MDVASELQARHLLPARGDAPALVFTPEDGPDRAISWEDLEERGRRLANALHTSAVAPGQAWAVLSHNRIEWAELVLGNARAGTRIVPLNWHLTVSEVAELLRDSGSQLVLCDRSQAKKAREAASVAGIDQVRVFDNDYETWRDGASDAALPECPAGSPMMFTGGTTGRSKGVNRSDQGIAASDWHRIYSGWGSLLRMPTVGTTLVTTPLYHSFGLAVLAASLSRGMAVVLAERFDAINTLALIEAHNITNAPMVPTQFVRLLKLAPEDRSAHDVSSIEWILHTAAPCPAWAKREMIEWFGPVIYEMYGSSEGTGPAVCDSHEWLAKPGTVGKATAVVEYSIVGEDGNDLPPGEVGTIYCRRPDGTPSYHGDPDKTEAMKLPDGRFTVGDLGWLDEDGYLFLADRRVDLIITGGANVYPAEIEAVLIEHPTVNDAAVFGIPDPEWGQQIKAVVELAGGQALDVADLADFASGRLASYKVPKSFDVVDALPREAHGKLKKRLLRDPYWENV